MAQERVSKKMSRTAGRMFDEIAHELSNGKKVELIQVFDALAAKKPEVKKLVKEFLKK